MTSNETSVDKDIEEQAANEAATSDADFQAADSPDKKGEQTESESNFEQSERIAELEAQLDEARQQASDASDGALRTTAEMQNLRRRTERDVENAHKFGQEKLVNSLLPVLDNLDRALSAVSGSDEASSESVQALLEGVELTRKSAFDALEKFSVAVIEPVGEPFDPEFHEAMTMIPSETAEPNTVLEVLQKGYTLNGRLLRAAMVVVSK